MTSVAYLKYLLETLIPDLRDGGYDMSADDFEELAALIEHPHSMPPLSAFNTPERFVAYLEEELIPDLKLTGRVETAKDFETGVKLWRRRSKLPSLYFVCDECSRHFKNAGAFARHKATKHRRLG